MIAAPSSYASEQQAVRTSIVEHFSVHGIPHFPTPKVSQIGISGRYAVARMQTLIESSKYNGEVLLEHFPFGWQTLDIATDRRNALRPCDFTAHNISNKTAALLQSRAGIKSAPSDQYCQAAGFYAGGAWCPRDLVHEFHMSLGTARTLLAGLEPGMHCL